MISNEIVSKSPGLKHFLGFGCFKFISNFFLNSISDFRQVSGLSFEFSPLKRKFLLGLGLIVFTSSV